MAKTYGIILYPDSITFNAYMSLCQIINAYEDSCDIAWIEHRPEPTPTEIPDKKYHIHLMVSSRSSISMNKIQELYQISEYCIEEIHDKDEFIRYLVHRTPKSRNKIQYEISELHHNFNIKKYFKSLENQAIDESDMVLDICNWAVRNNAYFLQVLSYVKHKGYNWQKFRMNSNIIFKAIDEMRAVPNSQIMRVLNE